MKTENPKQEEVSVMLEKHRPGIISAGVFDAEAAARALGLTRRSRDWERAWRQFSDRLYEETGRRMISVGPGQYRLDSASESVNYSTNTRRLAVARAARRQLKALAATQRRDDLSSAGRELVRREELIRSRDLALVERIYLRSKRKRPAGLEPEQDAEVG